jgi:predicted dehydrogenase
MDDAHAMVRACREADIPFMVHENFRWQAPIRAVKEAARSIGNLFFGRISFRSGYDVYADQPNLATDERFIIYDLGVHLLDLARFFFGEVIQLTGRMQRVNPNIRAEDVATILLTTESGAVCIVDMSYASKLEDELFPQTLVHLEGTTGSVLMGPHFALTTTNASGTTHRLVPPHSYDWTVPPTEVVQSSVVSIQQHWVDCLRGGRQPDTSGTDNLRTLALVFAAYASAESGLPVKPTDF